MIHNSFRQNLQLWLILLLILICCVAGSEMYLYWITVTICFASVYIMGIHFLQPSPLDLAFFTDENAFMYEPDYNHWKTFNEPEY